MMRLRVLPAMLLLTACGSPTDEAQDELRDHQRRWQALGIHSYTYDFRRSCFCGGPTGMLQIVVRNDSLISVTEVATGQPPRDLRPEWAGTIDQIFAELIRESDSAADIDLSFDDTYHFPSQVAIDRIKNAIDDEFELTLANLRPAR